MARKLTFGTSSSPRPIKTWKAKGRTAPALLHVLPDREFEKAAKLNGYDPSIGAFAVWNQWWAKDAIYLRANRLDLFVHEWRHIETQSNFHADDH